MFFQDAPSAMRQPGSCLSVDNGRRWRRFCQVFLIVLAISSVGVVGSKGEDRSATTSAAVSLMNKVGELSGQGKFSEALPLAERALAIMEKSVGPEHPDTAAILTTLGELHRLMGNYLKAEPLSQRALAITEKLLGPEHTDTAIDTRIIE